MSRPDPDELLARVQAAERQQKRGKLKIFFGAAAGVGKTYAMLEAAQARLQEGEDVVVGYVESHARPETEALLVGLERLPLRMVDYHGQKLSDFDLDAALVRRPGLIVVDELAHTNLAGSRHAKRWQDILELLAAGLNVYTTVNVQHLESLNDIVAQITGVVVRETFPDTVLEQADEVELIDLPPDDLLQRLQEGKVYLPQQAEQAMRHFFRKGNLLALRELALRRTADRVDTQMRAYKQDHAIAQSWPAGERLLVCVGPSPLSRRLVRATRRMATALRAEWLAVHVEKSPLPLAQREQVAQTLRLAEQLGAEVVTLNGHNISEEIVTYARSRNVSKIVVGKPARPQWHELLFGSIVDDLVRHSGEIDVYVITGEPDGATANSVLFRPESHSQWSAYLQALMVVLICTVIDRFLFPYLDPANLIMVYLLGIVVTAGLLGRGPSILASILSVLAFDINFVPPYYSLTVEEAEYLITFAVMLITGLTISTLTARVRQQALSARQRERHTAALYAMSREFATIRGRENVLQTAVRHVSELFDSQVAILLADSGRSLNNDPAGYPPFLQNETEQSVAQWVFDHRQRAGAFTETLPGAKALYLPLTTLRDVVGVMGVCPAGDRRFQTPDELHLLETFANQIALAIERVKLAEETEEARIQIETEQLRSTLLSSLSHDLRTPLAAITGAATAILADENQLSPAGQRDMVQTIYEEANRLNRLLRNVLEMTKLESGAIQVKRNWQPLEEVIGTALSRLEDSRPIITHLPADLPLVAFDEVLIEQVLVNLLENALKYTPAGSSIELSASADANFVTIEVADRGPGLPPGEEERIFNKFYRVEPQSGVGVGLGLAICRGIVTAHNGRIWAESRPGGGALFRFTLPILL